MNAMRESDLIAQLADGDAARRAAAFDELWSLGAALGAKALEKISADGALRSLLVSPADPYHAVGVAVGPARFRSVRAAWNVASLERVPAERQVEEFHLGRHGRRLDVIAGTSPESPISRFVAKRGEGIQQVEILVGDVDAVTERIRQLNDPALRLASDRPVEGAGGTRVNFALVTAATGEKVLLEFVAAPEGI